MTEYREGDHCIACQGAIEIDRYAYCHHCVLDPEFFNDVAAYQEMEEERKLLEDQKGIEKVERIINMRRGR